MKLVCLKCKEVKVLTGAEYEQKVAMFNAYMHGAADYLNLFSLTGGDCKVKDEKLGSKHFFEFEEETEMAISAALAAYSSNEKDKVKAGQELNLEVAKKQELELKLQETESLIVSLKRMLEICDTELEQNSDKFTSVTGIKDVLRWK